MDTSTTVNHEILRRYDRPGPRYTSYPTAPQFTTDFGEERLRHHILRSNEDPIPRPLSIYIHVPYCFYSGCNRIITRDVRKGDRYLEHLTLEIERVSSLFDRDRDVLQVHLGGGTPNFLRPTQLAQLMESLARHFHFGERPSHDFSIELDPQYVDIDDIDELAAIGLNRASLWVQDVDPVVQHAVNRVQGIEQTLAVIQACRDTGFRSVNLGLIYGLPKQSVEHFSRTLDIVLAARPDRLTVYGYAHLPRIFKAQRPIKEEELPDAATRLSLLALAIDKLTAAGYEYIGLDDFALPQDDLARARLAGTLHRNFMGYTTHAECDLLGLGVSAISHVGDSYSQNARDLSDWEIALECGQLPVWRGLEMNEDDVLRADIIQQLMCARSIDIDAVERRFDIDFLNYFSDALQELEQLAADGLVTIDKRHIAVTSQGRYVMRIIGTCFDRYLQPACKAAGASRFFKAI